MESHNMMDEKIHTNMNQMLQHGIIRDRRFLDDEQLIESEQLALQETVFNSNVRDAEIREISCHLAPILRNDHPMHLAVWGKTGTGKTMTISYFLNVLAAMCAKQQIPLRRVHLDLSTPRPCFRALNDLACLLDACKYYKRGLPLDEFMYRIETKLARYRGYLVLFIDEVDNVRRDKDTFMAFLIRRLPQKIPAKLILVFASNRLDWADNLDPRVKSFFKVNELIFKPYDAIDLQQILQIRVDRALRPGAVEAGVIEKIAAYSSRDHGDARQAVQLLAQSAYLAEKTGGVICLDVVDKAAEQIEQDKYVTMIRTAPRQLQMTLAAVLLSNRRAETATLTTGQVYDTYKHLCGQVKMRPQTPRAIKDLIAELDLYTFIRSRVISRGRYGRTREIILDLPEHITGQIETTLCEAFNLAKLA